MNDSASGSAETSVTIKVGPPLAITTPASLPTAMASSACSGSIGVSGGTGPYLFARTAGSLPAGVSLSSSGAFSGTPVVAGTATFTVTVTDADGRTAVREFSLKVVPQLVLTTTRLRDGFVDTAYSLGLAATGGEGSLTWSVSSGALPPGFVLDGTSGVISGSSSVPSSQTVTITVTDGGGRTVSRSFPFRVTAPLAITTTALADGHAGVDYSQPVEISGGIPPYLFSYSGGTFPSGLGFNSQTGLISGVPSASVSLNLQFTVSDSTWPTPQTATRSLTFRSVIDQLTTVQVIGPGRGTVTSTPAAFSCSTGSCSTRLGTGYSYLLHPEPAEGSIFYGWSGACTGTGDCNLLISSSQVVTAMFALKPYTLSVSVSGGGTVASSPAGILCSAGTCTGTFNHGTVVTLSPAVDLLVGLDGWGGACSGSGPCTITMAGDTAVSAAFTPGRALDVSIAGSGSVHSDPAGIACAVGNCIYTFPLGEAVSLEPTPSLGFVFSSWSGACSGSGPCAVTLDGRRSVTATFVSPPPAKVGSTFYDDMQKAYDAAVPGDVIMLKEGVQPGSLTANGEKEVTLRRGYNAAYSGPGGDSIIKGAISIGGGSIIFDCINCEEPAPPPFEEGSY